MADAPGEYRIDRAGEVIAVLQEKRALLGEEDFETLIDGDLRLVRFDLAEVRIDGGIEDEAVMQNEFCVQSDLGLQPSVFKEGIGRIALVDVPEPAQQAVRNNLDVPGAGKVQAGGAGGLVEAALNAIGNSRPE